jgi:ubiquinone/menaquinone biosynthesis C-methylase UbiE
MKARESGMPDEALWESFFDPRQVLAKLMPSVVNGDAVEFGCGYGTFTIPAARRVRSVLYALDIEQEMVDLTATRAKRAGLENVRASRRDFVAQGTGLPDGSVAYAMLFNILHAEQPADMLDEAYRILAGNGTLGIMHWNYDAGTPRGPSMEIRPRPEQCRDWAIAAGFELVSPGIVCLPLYHYGMVMRKPRCA